MVPRDPVPATPTPETDPADAANRARAARTMAVVEQLMAGGSLPDSTDLPEAVRLVLREHVGTEQDAIDWAERLGTHPALHQRRDVDTGQQTFGTDQAMYERIAQTLLVGAKAVLDGRAVKTTEGGRHRVEPYSDTVVQAWLMMAAELTIPHGQGASMTELTQQQRGVFEQAGAWAAEEERVADGSSARLLNAWDADGRALFGWARRAFVEHAAARVPTIKAMAPWWDKDVAAPRWNRVDREGVRVWRALAAALLDRARGNSATVRGATPSPKGMDAFFAVHDLLLARPEWRTEALEALEATAVSVGRSVAQRLVPPSRDGDLSDLLIGAPRRYQHGGRLVHDHYLMAVARACGRHPTAADAFVRSLMEPDSLKALANGWSEARVWDRIARAVDTLLGTARPTDAAEQRGAVGRAVRHVVDVWTGWAGPERDQFLQRLGSGSAAALDIAHRVERWRVRADRLVLDAHAADPHDPRPRADTTRRRM